MSELSGQLSNLAAANNPEEMQRQKDLLIRKFKR
jgi:hypothetical protein